MREKNTDGFVKLRKDDLNWMDKNGQIIPIKDIDNKYAFNIVCMLRKKEYYINEIYNKGIKNKVKFEIPDLILEKYEKYCYEYPEYCI